MELEALLLRVFDFAVDMREDLLELFIIGDLDSSSHWSSFGLSNASLCFFKIGLYMSPPFVCSGCGVEWAIKAGLNPLESFI